MRSFVVDGRMIVEFHPTHCHGSKAHPSQAHYQHMLDDPRSFRELWPETYSALEDGELIAIGGSISTDGVTSGWVLFTDKITPARFVPIHRAVARFMDIFEHPIFAHVDPDNPAAVRWAGLLGLETRRADVLTDGRRMLRVEGHVSS